MDPVADLAVIKGSAKFPGCSHCMWEMAMQYIRKMYFHELLINAGAKLRWLN